MKMSRCLLQEISDVHQIKQYLSLRCEKTEFGDVNWRPKRCERIESPHDCDFAASFVWRAFVLCLHISGSHLPEKCQKKNKIDHNN